MLANQRVGRVVLQTVGEHELDIGNARCNVRVVCQIQTSLDRAKVDRRLDQRTIVRILLCRYWRVERLGDTVGHQHAHDMLALRQCETRLRLLQYLLLRLIERRRHNDNVIVVIVIVVVAKVVILFGFIDIVIVIVVVLLSFSFSKSIFFVIVVIIITIRNFRCTFLQTNKQTENKC